MIEKSKTILKTTIIILVIIVIIKISLVFLWPFLFSIILVLIMEPMVKFFISKNMKRNTAVVLTFIIYIIGIILFSIYIWNYLSLKVVTLSDNIPKVIDTYRNYPLFNAFSDNYERILLEIKNMVIEYKEKILETIISTINGVVYIFIILMAALFISIDLNYLSKILHSLLGENIYKPIRNSILSANKLIGMEVKLVSITVIITSISLMILGFNDYLSIGIFCGILDLLPIVGILMIFLPIILYLIATNQIFIALGLIFTYLLIIVVRQVLEIKFLQGNLVMKPIFVMFSLYCGVTFFGTLGVIFGPLILIMFKEVYRSLEKGDLT